MRLVLAGGCQELRGHWPRAKGVKAEAGLVYCGKAEMMATAGGSRPCGSSAASGGLSDGQGSDGVDVMVSEHHVVALHGSQGPFWCML